MGSITKLFIPELSDESEAIKQRATLVISFGFAMLMWVPVFAPIYLVLGSTMGMWVHIAAGLMWVACLATLRLHRSINFAGHWLCFCVWTALFTGAYYTGGASSPSSLWLCTMPLIGQLLFGFRAASCWAFVGAMTVAFWAMVAWSGNSPPNDFAVEVRQPFLTLSLIGLITCVWCLSMIFQSIEKRFRSHLDAARVAAEGATLAKSKFLANMSHELRTPMTSILGFAELLEERGLELSDRERQEALSTIRRSGNHLLAIIDDILDISKIEAGKMMIEFVEIDLVSFLDEIEQLMRIRSDKKGIDLKTEFLSEIPQRFTTDPIRLRQILSNLIGNSIKFTEHGSILHRLRCESTALGTRQLVFEVADTGIGMTHEQCEHVFEAFSQADSSTTRRFGGSGLGLSISSNLALLLGGSLTVSSTRGEGSVFTLQLPLDEANVATLTHPKELRSLRPDHGVAISGPGSPPPSRLAGTRILLAEDGPDNQRLISFFLRKAGAECVIAENGQRALELVHEAAQDGSPFDLILMDMQMPVMDGYSAVARLKHDGYHVPVVALTANAMSGDRKKCLEAGCDEYLSKPVQRLRLIEIVERFVDTSAFSAADEASTAQFSRTTPTGTMPTGVEVPSTVTARAETPRTETARTDRSTDEVDG